MFSNYLPTKIFFCLKLLLWNRTIFLFVLRICRMVFGVRRVTGSVFREIYFRCLTIRTFCIGFFGIVRFCFILAFFPRFRVSRSLLLSIAVAIIDISVLDKPNKRAVFADLFELRPASVDLTPDYTWISFKPSCYDDSSFSV